MAKLAILSAQGGLPLALAAGHPEALIFTLHGVPHDHKAPTIEHRFDRLGELIADMKSRGVSEVVFAGGMSRPTLDPSQFDDLMQKIAPQLLQAFQTGDDALLRFIIALFEDSGIAVRGAHELLPDLTANPGLLAGPEPEADQLKDAAKATEILNTLAPMDVGQGVVVAAGLCLGIETLQGTDALLQFVAQTPDHLRRAPGVFVKAPKAGQDLRVDMPTIGVQTIDGLAAAGIAGIVIAAGRVLLVDKPGIIARANDCGIFVLAQENLG